MTIATFPSRWVAILTAVPMLASATGGLRDEHGCMGSAGYTYCETKSKCLRTWEEDCPSMDDVVEQLRQVEEFFEGSSELPALRPEDLKDAEASADEAAPSKQEDAASPPELIEV
eukprot:TRINITY_DN87515_c0_g1_i1.p1 TRINITY_DN87515_c0_g1~~TRINITY_DN87515_c0_g1_i1.p1  ORF type:complete len:115 (-),score=46.03 TRINITY_DN87515_c0_g1_i1:101-445(-)